MKHHYIYKIIIKGTSFYYFGKHSTSTEPALDGYFGSGTALKQFQKCQMEKTILEFFQNSDAAFAAETKIIGDLWKTDPNCLNSKPGGKGAPLGKDHHWYGKPTAYKKSGPSHHAFGKKRPLLVNQKISLGQKNRDPNTYLSGNKHPGFGKCRSDDVKKKISEKNKGRILGPFSKEHCEKISKSLKGYVKSKEHQDKINFANKNNSEKRKAARRSTARIFVNGKAYGSLRHASEELGITPYFIKKLINHQT